MGWPKLTATGPNATTDMLAGRYGDFHSVFVWKNLFLDVFHAFVQLPPDGQTRGWSTFTRSSSSRKW